MLASASSVHELTIPFGVHPYPILKAHSDLARVKAEISQESRGVKKVQFAPLPDKHFAPITFNKRRERNNKKNKKRISSTDNGGYASANGTNGHIDSSAETLSSNSSGEGSPPPSNGGSPPHCPLQRPESSLRELMDVLVQLSRDMQEVLRRLPPATTAQQGVESNSTSPQR